MRARLIPVTVAASALASCFQVDPLPDCVGASDDGLHTPHYVCMPRAGAPLEMPVAPRRLLRGDFDDEGVDNDFAVLLDLGLIQIYTTRDQKTELTAGLQIAGKIEAIAAARYFDGEHGDDLLGVTAGDKTTGASGTVFGFHNGGDVFQAATLEQFDAATLFPFGNCPAPNSLESLDFVGMERSVGLAVGCESGPPPSDKPEEEPLDGMVIGAEEATAFALQPRLGLQIPALVGVHAVNVAQLDGLALEDIVFAHQPGKMGADQSIAIFPVAMEAFSGMGAKPERIDVPLEHGEIRRVLVDDLDGDADIDLVAVHPTDRGISVVRQRRSEPLSFESPQYFAVGQEIRDAVIGDFTGDGEVDIAVAHDVDGTGLNAISVLIRTHDLSPGTVDYVLAPAGEISGEIVDLEPLDYDGDGRTDIGVVLKVGSEGRVFFWLNRSPAGE